MNFEQLLQQQLEKRKQQSQSQSQSKSQQNQKQQQNQNQNQKQNQKEWKKKVKIDAVSLEIFLTAKVTDSENKLNEQFSKFNQQIADWVQNGVHLSKLRNLDMKDYFSKDKTVRMDLFDTKNGVSIRINQEKFANLFYTRMRAIRGYAGKSAVSSSNKSK
jgi:hypothetical protein